MNVRIKTSLLACLLPALGACCHHHCPAPAPRQVSTAPHQVSAAPHQVSTAHQVSAAPRSHPFAREMDAGMEKMMADMHAPGYTGNADLDFLAMMIPHHEGAVEMARLLLIHGEDPLARRLAEEIIASQTAEIAAMRQRLVILRQAADPDPGGFPALHGTRGTAPR